MRSLRDRESMQRGSPDYPLDYYLIDRNHPRYEMPYHWHAETELLHVISGQFSMTIDEETFLLAAGDAVYIAPGRLHGGKPDAEQPAFRQHEEAGLRRLGRPVPQLQAGIRMAQLP